MYELDYVKKRKRKKVVALVALISSIGITALGITAFLGRFVGTFTVTLNTGSVALSLSEKSAFQQSSSYLHIDNLLPFEEYTYTKLPSANTVDSDETDYLIGANYDDETQNNVSFSYFKYTFFIKNTGNKTARYTLSVKLLENSPSNDGRYLDSVMRVMIFENNPANQTHNAKVYAKQSETMHYDEEGNETFKEYISYSAEQAQRYGKEFPGFAEMFESNSTIATLDPVYDFEKDDVKRYTIVTWIEGEDPQSNGYKEAPQGAKLKIGVEINAYENE